MIYRKCAKARCPALVETGVKFCPAHQSAEDRRLVALDVERLDDEPWRRLYDTPEWKRCARLCRSRDGFQCQGCGKLGSRYLILTVHHRTPVRVIYERIQGVWSAFMDVATNPDICLTLCPECHKRADADLQADQAEVLAPFYPVARPVRRNKRA